MFSNLANSFTTEERSGFVYSRPRFLCIYTFHCPVFNISQGLPHTHTDQICRREQSLLRLQNLWLRSLVLAIGYRWKLYKCWPKVSQNVTRSIFSLFLSRYYAVCWLNILNYLPKISLVIEICERSPLVKLTLIFTSYRSTQSAVLFILFR